ncbi:hypothetical protein N9V29_04605 [Flavobacteriales bacterium]|nr:hypothetical protein [Flavobacteriales bacterium]
MKRLLALMLCALSLGVIGQEECNDVSPFLTAVEQVPLELLGMSDSTMFFKSEDSLNWQEAQDYSSFLGGHLATFSSSEEYDLIQTTWSSPFGLWFGLRQNVFDEEPAGGWGWVTNEDSTFSAWGSSEPNNGPNINYSEDCGEIVEGFWNDAWCLVTRRFIIEVPISKVRCSEQAACNFDPEATIDDGSCYSCDIPESHCGPGTIWDAEMQLCIIANPADINLDGCVQLGDLLNLLAAYGDCGAEESVWQCGDPVSYQGYDYQTVQIGEQCWFAENVRAMELNDGTLISQGVVSQTPGLSYYNNDPSLGSIVGLHYNYWAALDVCPNDWHLPTDVEFNELMSFLNQQNPGALVSGLVLKASEDAVLPWNGTNSTGFTGLPGGFISQNGMSYQYGADGGWWWTRNTLEAPEVGHGFSLTTYNDMPVSVGYTQGDQGRSVRCIKDSE